MTDPRTPRLDLASLHFFSCVALAGIALIGYLGMHYGWPSESGVAIRYGFALCIATVGVLCRQLPPPSRAAVAILCFALIGSLLLSEWLIERREAAEMLRFREREEAATGIPYDARSIPEVVRDLRAAGVSAVPSIVSSVLLPATEPGAAQPGGFPNPIIPFAGISNEVTVQLCNEDGRHVTYRSDRFGFSNPDLVWDMLSPRLVLIGDSFVHGYCVDPDSTLPAWIRKVWPPTLNLGMGGSGPLSELAVLSEYGSSAHPTVLLWVYYENDLDDLVRERGSAAVSRYLEAGYTQGLVNHQATIDSSLRAWVHSQFVLHRPVDPLKTDRSLVDLVKLRDLRELVDRIRMKSTRRPEEEIPLFTRILEKARDRSEAMGASMVFVFLPSWERCFSPSALPHDAARGEVLMAARQVGLPILDLTQRFASFARPEMLYAKRDITSAHYSAIGYGYAAQWILQGLDSLGFWPLPGPGGERGTNATPRSSREQDLGLGAPGTESSARCVGR